jgi:HDOD domain
MLVIVVVAAGIVIAAAIFWRVAMPSHRGSARAEGARDNVDSPEARSPERPMSTEGPPSGHIARYDASASGSFAPTLAPGPSADSDAGAAQPEPAATKPGFGDASELEFTIDVPEAQRRTSDPASKAPPPSGPAATAAPLTPPAPTRSPGGAGSAPAADAESLQPPEVFAKLFDLALGKARPASTVTSGHEDVAAATAAALEDAATQQRYAPRRPNMLPKILSASNDDSFSQRELASLIARDPALVGNLLKIANSSYYRVTQDPVESVDRAVVLLGTDGIRSLVTAALMQPIFRIGGADFPRFPEIAWEHTFRSASAAVPYNFLVEKSDPFAAELLSLVMGLAEIVVFRVTMDQYARNPRLRPDAGVVSALLDAHSATVARRIGASWELSEQTLAGLDGQAVNTTTYPTALGRSLYFGRVVGALAVLRINRVIDDVIGMASVPPTNMPEAQIERMWMKLTFKLEKD